MLVRVAMGVATALIVSLLGAFSASAAVTVGNTNDSGPGSLRQAIADAPPGEAINLPAGTYDLTSPITIAKSVTLAGHGSADTNLRSANNNKVFQLGPESALTLTDLSFRDMTVSAPGGVIQGGLISAGISPITMQRVVFSGITLDASGAAEGPGGVIQGGLLSSSGPLSLTDTAFVRNRVLADGGAKRNGGVIQGGLMISGGGNTFTNVALDENVFSAKGGQGPPDPGQNGGVIQGGVGLLGQNKPVTSVYANVSASANRADVSSGPGSNGGIVQGLALTLSAPTGRVEVSNTTVADNTGLASGATNEGLVQSAGLVAVVSAGATMTILDSTLFGNRGPTGPTAGAGNLLAAGPITIRGTIIAAGGGGAGKENCDVGESAMSGGFNIDSTDQCGFHSAGDKINTDPQLAAVAPAGGIGLSAVPLASSPAVDQGSAFGLASDGRGVIRPIDFPSIATAPGGDGSDIGAVELQPSNLLTVGALKRNRKKGTATLTVNLPQPSAGTLVLAGKFLKTQTKAIAGEGTLKLKVVAKGKARKALRKKGKRKLGLSVTYTPIANTAATVTRKVKLVKKKRHRSHKKRAK
jgi:hypothetical protein